MVDSNRLLPGSRYRSGGKVIPSPDSSWKYPFAASLRLEELANRCCARTDVTAGRPVDIEPVAEDFRGEVFSVKFFL